MIYTAVTFAPVQGFILASRKLRDLYASSLLISHLARAQAEDAEGRGHVVISPADFHTSRGVPNVLVIRGDYSRSDASAALLGGWQRILGACKAWIEDYFEQLHSTTTFDWESSWQACARHSWELFHGQGSSIQEARTALAIYKQQRDWAIPNWTGESSTLSSAEAVVRPAMGARVDPRSLRPGDVQEEARSFLRQLRQSPDLGVAFAGDNEEISLTELVKRLISYPAVARIALATGRGQTLTDEQVKALLPERFQRLTTMARAEEAAALKEQPESIVWFMADGDGIGEHLESLAQQQGEIDKDQAEEKALQSFSAAMRTWAASLYQLVPGRIPGQAMVVYAGGDDLFGALHESEPGKQDLTTTQLIDWLLAFPELWKRCGQEGLTSSMGLVWADAKVPQREALQHAREAEASAKARGKDRFALRLLYANGNHLEWTCPWAWFGTILNAYTDREGRTLAAARDGRWPSWRHLAEDLQWLQSRQAIAGPARRKEVEGGEVCAYLPTAQALWNAYFPGCTLPEQEPSHPPAPGTTPFRVTFATPEKGRRFDQWLWDLGRVMAGLEKHGPPVASAPAAAAEARR